MVLFRMSKRKYATDLTGTGAKIAGGRWNDKGIAALYLAENRSLAILETIVHCHYIKDLYNRVVLSIDLPDNLIDILNRNKLPNDWNKTPWHDYTINEGSDWLKSNSNLVLKVPSAIVPEENIYIVNPRHRDRNKIKIINQEIFKPDNRLLLSF